MSYVNVKGRGLKFNQMAVIILAQKSDPENWAASAVYAMVWAGLKANAYVKGEELDLTFEEACDWADGLTEDELKSINEALAEAEAYKKLLKEEKPDKKKEKEPRRKSQPIV